MDRGRSIYCFRRSFAIDPDRDGSAPVFVPVVGPVAARTSAFIFARPPLFVDGWTILIIPSVGPHAVPAVDAVIVIRDFCTRNSPTGRTRIMCMRGSACGKRERTRTVFEFSKANVCLGRRGTFRFVLNSPRPSRDFVKITVLLSVCRVKFVRNYRIFVFNYAFLKRRNYSKICNVIFFFLNF